MDATLAAAMRHVDESGTEGLTGIPLSGRDEEIRALAQAAEQVLDLGTPRIVSIVGPAGVGKTALIDHAMVALRGAQRFRVYRGDSRGSVPADAFASLLRSRLGVIEGASLDDARSQIRAQ